MDDTEKIAMLRKGLEDLGGAIMSVKDHNTPEWMEYIKNKIDIADKVLEATKSPIAEAPPLSSDAKDIGLGELKLGIKLKCPCGEVLDLDKMAKEHTFMESMSILIDHFKHFPNQSEAAYQTLEEQINELWGARRLKVNKIEVRSLERGETQWRIIAEPNPRGGDNSNINNTGDINNG